jgi:hypothetical protein
MTPNVVTSVLVPAVAQFTGGGQFDLCSLADVKDELDINTDKFDAWLKRQITVSSTAIEQFCNRKFQTQRYHEEFFPFLDEPPRKLRADLLPLQLSHWPISSPVSPSGVAPPAPPALSATSGGALAAACYYARITLVTAEGETAPSLEASLSVGADELLVVTSPAQDKEDLATGWNLFLGTAANEEVLQNASPMAIGTDFTLPTTGLITGTRALPSYLLAVESGLNQVPLAEGPDFIVRHDVAHLDRRHRISGTLRSWSSVPIVIEYQGGFASIPNDVQDAAIQLVKARWFARKRDPNVRSENIEGVYQADYWYGTGPGGPGDLPNFVAERLGRYRVPVIA